MERRGEERIGEERRGEGEERRERREEEKRGEERRGEERRGGRGEEREERIFKVEGSPQGGSCSSWREQPEKHQSSETSPC